MYDPLTHPYYELLKYGDVYRIERFIANVDNTMIEKSEITLQIKPEYENEVFLKTVTEVLIIIENDDGFTFNKMSREDAGSLYGLELGV